MWFTNRGTSTIGRIQAVEPETVTFVARYSDERCATIETVADAHGVDAAQVVGHGVHRLGLLADAGHDAAPVAEAPANDGPCEVAVTHPAKDAAMIETRAAQWGVDADELHHLGGQLVLAIIYVLAVGG